VGKITEIGKELMSRVVAKMYETATKEENCVYDVIVMQLHFLLLNM
jgi:hypothetical protein